MSLDELIKDEPDVGHFDVGWMRGMFICDNSLLTILKSSYNVPIKSPIHTLSLLFVTNL